MTRKLKPYEVDRVHNHETSVIVMVYLDRESKRFYGDVGDKRIEAQTADECRRAVRKELETYRPFVWEKIIEAYTTGVSHYGRTPPGAVKEDSHNTHFELHFRRYQRAKSLAKDGYLERGFGVEKEDFEDAFREKWVINWATNGATVLPYTDETWEKLVALEAGIKELNRRLEQLLDPTDGAKKLLALQVRALLALDKENKR